MRRITCLLAVISLCALLSSCGKKDDKYVDSVTYSALVTINNPYFGGNSLDTENCTKYFDALREVWITPQASPIVITAEGEDYEDFLKSADAVAGIYVKDLREKGMAKWTEVQKDIATRDLGTGYYSATFKYVFGRAGKDIDSFTEKLEYDGGIRTDTDEVQIDLVGPAYGGVTYVEYNGVIPEPGQNLTVKKIKVCLPDKTYMDENVYGRFLDVSSVTPAAGGEGYNLALNFTIDDTRMHIFKEKAGDWYAIVFFSVGSVEKHFAARIPIKIVRH